MALWLGVTQKYKLNLFSVPALSKEIDNLQIMTGHSNLNNRKRRRSYVMLTAVNEKLYS